MKYLKTFKNIQKYNESEVVEEKTVTGTSPKISREDIKSVEKMLGSDYDSFIKALTGVSGVPSEEMVAEIDPKIKAILNMGRKDKNLQDEIVKYTTPNLAVKNLQPTQSQIGLADSIGFIAFKTPDACKTSLSGSANFGGGAILTADNKYILDGHHRWSQVFMINPDATIPCVNLNLGVKSSEEALKIIQVAIAASFGDPNEPGKLFMKPASAKTDLFDDSITGPKGEKLSGLLERIFKGDPEVVKMPKGGSLDNVTKFMDILKQAWNTDEKGVIQELVKNAVMIKGYKPESAPARGFMPQPSDTAAKLGEPTDDGPGGMPAKVITKLTSGSLNFKDPINPADTPQTRAQRGLKQKNPNMKVLDNFNTFLKR
jgi:hypothetical protein